MSATVERLCTLPRDFRSGSSSAIALVQASGYCDDPEVLTVSAVRDVLARNPALVEDWIVWSDDKRTDRGWVFRREGPVLAVYYHPSGAMTDEGDGKHFSVPPRQEFSEPLAACAEYIVREVRSIARSA